MLNRIAVSGGTYQDYISAVWDNESWTQKETPWYIGGLSKEITFQEVVSTAATKEESLGTLAGKGVTGDRKKGGSIYVKIDEPSYIIGIVSITPRIDYSQGNNWDNYLISMNDFHKPALDAIGFQDSINDQRAFWDTGSVNSGYPSEPQFHSMGKVPAWINYMTNVNKCYGNFADPDKEMYMTLNRRYEMDSVTGKIKDQTTYIDPSKFNYMFAQTNLDAQNFWTQIAVDITARRKMSAKIIPNL